MMLWIYRIAAAGLVGFGVFLLLEELGYPEGLEILIPREAVLFMILGLVVAPAAVNLINSFLGRRFSLLRWGVVVINASFSPAGVL